MESENEINGSTAKDIPEPSGEKRNTGTYHLVDDDQADSEGYGCLSWRPSWLQFLDRGRYFCIFLCLIVGADAFNSGTFGSAVTSLETRYQLPSSQLGFINSMYEFASLVLVVFVVYYGGKPTSNRPLWIGLGSMLMGVGALVALLPQFLFGAYIPLVDQSSNGETGTSGICFPGSNSTDFCSSGDASVDADANNTAFVLIICGMIIIGLGWTPVMALGMSYIDDNVKTGTSAMYIGYVQSMFGFGRIAGFLIGGVTVRKWVDYYRDDPANYGVGPEDAQWVGAWWIGLIIAALLYTLSGFPMLGFPRSLPKTYEEEHHDFMGKARKHGKNPSGAETSRKLKREGSKKKPVYQSITDMPRKFWSVLKNPLFVSINMAFVTEFAAQLGLNIFFPKYLETEFGLTSSYANLITGAVLVPAAALGSILGGIIVKKFKTKAEGSCKVALVLSIIAMVLVLITFGIGCRTVPVAGVTAPYPDQSSNGLNRTDACNAQCGCGDDLFSPVCGSDGITYVTPCHAGCMDQEANGTFIGCSCIGDIEYMTAIDGSCGNRCRTLIPFLIISFLVVIISGAEEIPQTLISMRCVDADSKAIGLGIRAIAMRLLGAIPAPLIYGAGIDTACRLWQTNCGKRGSCFVYDLDVFRYAYLGINLMYKILTVVFYLISWWLIRRQRMSNHSNGKIGGDGELTDGPNGSTTATALAEDSGINGGEVDKGAEELLVAEKA